MASTFYVAVLFPVMLFAGGHIVYRLLREFELVRRVRVAAHLFLLLLSVRLFCLLAMRDPMLSQYGCLENRLLLNVVTGLLVFCFSFVALKSLDTIVIEQMLRVGDEVPFSRFARDIFILIVLIGIGVGILAYYNIQLSAFLTASAVLSAIIGLALQDILGNIFAGIALSVGVPFRKGDWVGIGDKVFQVIQRNWRSTRFRTLDDDDVIHPNAVVAKAEIVNFSQPTRAHAQHVRVRVDLGAPPERVKAVLARATASVDGVLSAPAPVVWLVEYADFSAVYNIKYWIWQFERYPQLDDDVMTRAWYALRREGFEIPVPIHHVQMREPAPDAKRAEQEARRRRVRELVDSVELFSSLSEADREAVAARACGVLYMRGEPLVVQGEEGDSFFVIDEGRVSVRVREPDGPEEEVAQLGPTEFFGEMSLLTGAKRSATVVALEETRVVVVDKQTFEAVLRANPVIAQSLSEVLAKIEAENACRSAAWAKKAEQEAPPPTSSGAFLRMIKKFFGLE